MVILCCRPQIEQLLKLGRLVIALAGARPALYEVTDLMKEALQAAPNVHLIEDRLVTLVEAAQVGWVSMQCKHTMCVCCDLESRT